MVSAPSVVILTGVTASGKSALALELAADNNAEIVNADSMLVYRGMDIGTAKPSLEERARVPHHLIDIRDPDQPYNAADFARDANLAIESIHSRGKRALIVGGTGFYLKALLFGLWDAPPADPAVRARLELLQNHDLFENLKTHDPRAAAKIGQGDRYRLIRALEIFELTGKTPTALEEAAPKTPDPRFQLWVVDRESEELFARIVARTKQMLEAGLLDEVRALRTRFGNARALSAIGYREAVAYLDGGSPAGRKPLPGLAGLEAEITLGTRQLVKSQRTWFKAQAFAERFTLPQDTAVLAARYKAGNLVEKPPVRL